MEEKFNQIKDLKQMGIGNYLRAFGTEELIHFVWQMECFN